MARNEQQIKDVTTGLMQSQMTLSLGVIISYDKFNNTATVAVTENDTDEIREVLKAVPCPMQIGVQSVAPEPGWLAVVMFKNGKLTNPIIINFYNHRYERHVYERQTKTPYSIPNHLMS